MRSSKCFDQSCLVVIIDSVPLYSRRNGHSRRRLLWYQYEFSSEITEQVI
jgi:hypothetical protein